MLIQSSYFLFGLQKLALVIGYLVILLSSGFFTFKVLRIESLIESVKELRISTSTSNQLLNITNFEFLENPKNICSQFHTVGSKTILNVVHSARGNFRKREIIRRTFGSVKIFRDWHIQTVFILGLPVLTEDASIADVLEVEIKELGDIIVGNFIDTYQNLTFKHLAGYKYAVDYCESVNYYIKTDDDMVVDIFHVIEYLTKNISKNVNNDYYCYNNPGHVERRPGFKWQVSREEYKNDKFPAFCGLGVYVTGIQTVKKILSVSSIQNFISLDDVFTTGFLRDRANMKENVTARLINLVPAKTPIINVFDKNVEDLLREGILATLSTSGLRNTTCLIWNSILEAHDLTDTFLSTCQSLN